MGRRLESERPRRPPKTSGASKTWRHEHEEHKQRTYGIETHLIWSMVIASKTEAAYSSVS